MSLATASRVATGSANVRPVTRRRVEEAMRELLYVPPARERTGRTVGLLVPDLSNPIFPALAQAMETRATQAGFVAILCNTAATAMREADYVHLLLERRVDAMIFISCAMTDVEGEHSHYVRLLAEGARLLFVNGVIEVLDIPSVGVDERAAGQLATRHLVELGHRRIGYASGPDRFLPTREKLEGIASTLTASGLPEAERAEAAFTVEGGRRAAAALLSLPKSRRPTGVVCSNDLMAVGVMEEARERGFGIPGDLSVVGFDGIDAGAWLTPPLTTVSQPIDDLADTAIQAVTQLVEQPARVVPHSTFRPRLTVRGSTARPR